MSPAAIVTGGSGGIGTACARTLAPDHDILVHYHSDADGATTAVNAVEKCGGTALTYKCDISNSAEVADMVQYAVETFGTVDVLVNNAGFYTPTDVTDITDEQIRKYMAVNLEGTIYCTRETLPVMCAQGSGRIVNISSVAGTIGSPTDPVYGATKGGIVAFTKSLAQIYSEDGIFSNVVAPGPTDTDLFPDDRYDQISEQSPLGRLVRPEEVAEAVRFFAKTESISGRVLTVNGGGGV